MISRTASHCQMPDWRSAMAQAICDPAILLEALQLPHSLLPKARAAAHAFGLRVPRGYLALMEPGNPADPLLRQVLPIGDELREVAGFDDDPVGDAQAVRGHGLLAKYQGRALLIASPACAVHCRYCFRRAFPYAEQTATPQHWDDLVQRLRASPETQEVILSGGDPLTLDDAKLAALIAELDTVPHLRRLRIHSRLPVVIPQRITEQLLETLRQTRLRVALVMHFNHPAEISALASERLELLRGVCTLLNQSVLLKGVNDDADTLASLSETLFDSAVLPYYIHLLDRVRGAAHFEVDEAAARGLMGTLRERLPGYLVPRLVKEEKGRTAKTLLV
jgi:EF-P beta-lysylation protein EpmB